MLVSIASIVSLEWKVFQFNNFLILSSMRIRIRVHHERFLETSNHVYFFPKIFELCYSLDVILTHQEGGNILSK